MPWGGRSTLAATPCRTALSLIAHCAGESPDVIVVEVADGVLQRETAHLLSCEAFRAAIDGVLFAAGDALGAVGGREWLMAQGHRVIGVSGLVSASPLAAREASQAMGEAVLTLSQLRDPLAAPQICFAADPAEAQILIEAWRRHYNTVRPHSSLVYRAPAPETATRPWLPSGSATLHLRTAMAPETVLH